MKVELIHHASIKFTGDKVIYFDPYKIEEEVHDADYIFITHDISLVKRIADKVAVMQNGYIVEQGTCESIFNHPQHDFSKQLLMS